MKRTALSVCLLLAVTAVAVGGEPSFEPVSEQPLHFRMEVGVRPGYVVSGWLDESKGTGKGYDLAVLDLDGDGTFETKQPAATQKDYQTQKDVPKPVVTIDREGAKWALDLYSLGRRRPTVKDGAVVTYIKWTVTTDAFYAYFINGRVTLHADAAKAKAAKPIRLGPPFSFDTGSAQRGPDALLRVGLKDGNGCTMRLARAGDGKTMPYRYIKVQLTSGEKQFLDTKATYG
jgi:hypothetical protein